MWSVDSQRKRFKVAIFNCLRCESVSVSVSVLFLKHNISGKQKQKETETDWEHRNRNINKKHWFAHLWSVFCVRGSVAEFEFKLYFDVSGLNVSLPFLRVCRFCAPSTRGPL